LTALLVEAVNITLELDFKDEKMVSKRDRLNQVWEHTNKKPPELKDIEIPEAGIDLFASFWELRKGESISWKDLYYYEKYTGISFNYSDVRIILKMDSAYNIWVQKKEKQKADARKNKKK